MAVKVKTVEQPTTTAPTETWDRTWNIRRRMLEARRRLRGTPLWQKFSLQRDFDAFSVHQLALGVENVLTDLGVISSFETLTWQKAGNCTIVTGKYVVTSVDDGECIEYATLGEAVDNGDKGVGKAISYARKNGMVSAMNLGIGIDNEASDEKAEPAAGPQMSGSTFGAAQPPPPYVKAPPPPPPKQADVNYTKPVRPGMHDYIQAAPTTGNPNGYVLRFADGSSRNVSAEGFLQQASIAMLNAPVLDQFDAFVKANKAEFDRFCAQRADDGQSLQVVQQTKRANLMRNARHG
jgi:hypothetical protein